MKKSIFEMVQNALDLCTIHSHLKLQKNRLIITLFFVVSVFIVKAQPWNKLPISNPITSGSNLLGIYFVDDSIGYVVGTGGTISKTTNGGVSWVSQSSGAPTLSLYATYFIDANTGFTVGDGGYIRRTEDGGANWVNVNITNPPANTSYRAVWFYNAYEGYIVGGVSGSSGAILKTINGGKDWTNISPSPNNLDVIYGIFFTDALTGYATDFNGRILKTTDGGATWPLAGTIVSPNNNLHGIYFTSKDTGYVVGGNTTNNTGVILKTVNASTGNSWLASGSTTMFLTDIKFFGNTGFAVGGHPTNNTNPVIYKNTPYSNLWTSQTINPISLLTTPPSRQYRVSLPCSHTGYSCGISGSVLKVTGINDKICCDSFNNTFLNANFTYAPTSVLNTYTFTKPAGTVPSDVLTWDFGDGQTSTAVSPTHTYPSVSNSYLATLTIVRPQVGGDTCRVKLSRLINTQPCPNLVINGDFSLGNTGFTTGLPNGQRCTPLVCDDGSYCVSNNFTGKCNDNASRIWPFSYDHTFGTAAGSFMSIDGNNTQVGSIDVWKHSTLINVVAGTTYKFTFWAKSVYPANQQALTLAMAITDNNTAGGFTTIKNVPISQTPINWTEYSMIWVCPPSVTTVSLALRQLAPTAFSDFGLDDIRFTCVSCEDFMTEVMNYGIQSTLVSGNTYKYCLSPNISPSDIVQWDMDCNGTIEPGTTSPCTNFTLTSANSQLCATVLHVIKPGDTCRAKVNDCLPNVQPMKPCSCDTAIFNNNVMAGFTWVKNSPYSITFTPISLLNNCDSIRWTFGNAGAIASSVGSASVTYTYPSVPGTYQVCMIVTRTEPSGKVCKKEFCLTIKLDGMTPTAEIALPNLTFKPNPTTNSVIITIPSTLNSKENVLRLSTIEGRIVKTISVESTETVMDLEILPAGLYFLSLIDNQGNMLTRPAKLVKQ